MNIQAVSFAANNKKQSYVARRRNKLEDKLGNWLCDWFIGGGFGDKAPVPKKTSAQPPASARKLRYREYRI